MAVLHSRIAVTRPTIAQQLIDPLLSSLSERHIFC
jgi:hypothetical protein